MVATLAATAAVTSVLPEIESDAKVDQHAEVEADVFPAADEVPVPVAEDERLLPEADASELIVDNASTGVEDTTPVEEIHVPDDVPSPGDSLSPTVDNVVVEGISPVSELPIANDNQAAQGSSVDVEVDVPQEKAEESLEVQIDPEDSPMIETGLTVQGTVKDIYTYI